MTDREKYRPFTGGDSRSFRLNPSPLAMVVCQLRWPELSRFREESAMRAVVAQLDEALKPYPIIEEGREAVLQMSAAGVNQVDGGSVFQWRTPDRAWTVTLTKRALTLTCTGGYQEFSELLSKLQPLVEAVLPTMGVPVLERVGVRYVNRISKPEVLDSLHQMLARHNGLPQKVGHAQLRQQVEQALYAVDDIALQVRAGNLDPNAVLDPAVEPIGVRAWILDLDAFREGNTSAEPAAVLSLCGKLSDACYDYFKHVASDKLIAAYGGEQ